MKRLATVSVAILAGLGLLMPSAEARPVRRVLRRGRRIPWGGLPRRLRRLSRLRIPPRLWRARHRGGPGRGTRGCGSQVIALPRRRLLRRIRVRPGNGYGGYGYGYAPVGYGYGYGPSYYGCGY